MLANFYEIVNGVDEFVENDPKPSYSLYNL